MGVIEITLPAASKPQRAEFRPWNSRAIKLFESEGMYADYAAWLEWSERSREGTSLEDTLDSVIAYDLCCRAIEESAPLNHQPERTQWEPERYQHAKLNSATGASRAIATSRPASVAGISFASLAQEPSRDAG